MLTDPQTITINSVANTLPRTVSEATSSQYMAADGNLTFKVSHVTSKGRVRHLVRLDRRDIVADPITALKDYESLGAYLVIDEPEVGFADADITLFVQGLLAWFTGANILKVLGQEH